MAEGQPRARGRNRHSSRTPDELDPSFERTSTPSAPAPRAELLRDLTLPDLERSPGAEFVYVEPATMTRLISTA